MRTTHRRSRTARRRAAVALLAYVAERTPENERALLDAAHELEAVAGRRPLQRVWQRGRSVQLARLATSR